MNFQNTLEFAQSLDQTDRLRSFREEFHFPLRPNDSKPVIYLTGNSLGLQPISLKSYIVQELDDWAHHGVEGHFHAKHPWVSYHKMFEEPLGRLVGALPNEVVCMNTLTVNLHVLMATFYRPTLFRHKIICEAGAFPSDQYAFESQAILHGYDPETTVIEIAPRTGEHTLRTEDILSVIREHGESIAVVLFSGVNYYTGQVFDMKAITEAAHSVGAYAGFDLAHAAGNVVLRLHDWDVDFAAWCSYKYLNSGPGGVSGAFIHEKHANNTELPRFAGWWGNDESERFAMKKGFRPAKGAQAWQLSNAPVLSMAAHKASLDIFDRAGMENLAAKRDLLTGFLEFVIKEAGIPQLEIITPSDLTQRGAQLSLLAHERGRELFDFLTERGVVADWRNPNVIRVAPAPLYVSFEDVWEFGQILREFQKVS